MKVFGILIILFFLSGCRGVSYEYQGEDGRVSQTMSVPMGSTKGSFDFTIVTNYAYPVIESDYPTITTFYCSKPNEANHLKRLEVKLVVDGKEIEPDLENYSAVYGLEMIELDKKDCCAMLGERLGIDVSKKNDPDSFAIHIFKKYKSLKRLPERLTVILTATSDKGTVEMERTMDLVSYKDRGFYRFH
jgi:hypothetical protein